ncbi:hypothetical protein STRIP9103_07623 [Streptomyces ipomoeae 91-03]|uniref:Uncharacterized protein n=1 Tax=Streptomyces ipomoeae 91-03 TaxID=698759 RepID=L1KTB8_9ACTN|nr:hypothetical protein STRIP9103_07623 [Streptomyces ipomoeae 91-03]
MPAGLRTRVRPDGAPSRSSSPAALRPSRTPPSGVVPRPSPSPLRVSSGFPPDSLASDVARLAPRGYQAHARATQPQAS